MYLYLCFCFWAEAASFRLLGIKRLFRPCCLGGWVLSVGSTYSPLYPHCEREFEAGGGFPARYLFWQDLPCCGGPRVLPRLACLRWWDRLTGAPWTGVTGKGVNRLPEPSCFVCYLLLCRVWPPQGLPQGSASPHPSPLLICPAHLVSVQIQSWGGMALLRLPSDVRLEVRTVWAWVLPSAVRCCCVAPSGPKTSSPSSYQLSEVSFSDLWLFPESEWSQTDPGHPVWARSVRSGLHLGKTFRWRRLWRKVEKTPR